MCMHLVFLYCRLLNQATRHPKASARVQAPFHCEHRARRERHELLATQAPGDDEQMLLLLSRAQGSLVIWAIFSLSPNRCFVGLCFAPLSAVALRSVLETSAHPVMAQRGLRRHHVRDLQADAECQPNVASRVHDAIGDLDSNLAVERSQHTHW